MENKISVTVTKKMTIKQHNDLVVECQFAEEYALFLEGRPPYVREKVSKVMFEAGVIHTFLQVMPLERTEGYDYNPITDLVLECYHVKKKEIQFLTNPPSPASAKIIIADKARWDKVHKK
jgi:hypothetical protein